jgi:hypothetical protein
LMGHDKEPIVLAEQPCGGRPVREKLNTDLLKGGWPWEFYLGSYWG